MSTTLYQTGVFTPTGPVTVTLPVRHVGIASDAERATAKPATIATAPNPVPSSLVGFVPRFDDTNPDNALAPGSCARGMHLLREGYNVSLWGLMDARTGSVRYCVDTPSGHEWPYYFCTFDGMGGAKCECAKSILGGKPCAHIAAVVRLTRQRPGLVWASWIGEAEVGAWRTETGHDGGAIAGEVAV